MGDNLQHLRILVVDDDALMLKQIGNALHNIGASNVTFVEDGPSALNSIYERENDWFDIFFLDLNMPGMDGVEVMRKLAATRYGGAITLFSGEDIRILKTAESLASAYNLNILGALSKPVTIDALLGIFTNYRPLAQAGLRAPIEPVQSDELREAIAKKQIQPFFQPKVKILDRHTPSAEVLARWLHPTRGTLSPITFIPIAEEEGLIDTLTLAIFEQALEQLGQWQRMGYELSLGINLSTDSLNQVDLPETLASIAEAYGVPCHRLIFEITESRLMKNLPTSLDVLTRLRLRGFGLSIDDFGTGYSSMSQLKRIPFTELKIDRAFVHDVHKDPSTQAILESCADLAKKLHMTIVAEGVENQDDWDSVAHVGCDLIQGYFIAKPMPAQAFTERLQHHS